MDKTKFEVRFVKSGENEAFSFQHFKKDGWDTVEFYISTNPGEPLKPLVKSGFRGGNVQYHAGSKNHFFKASRNYFDHF